MVEPRLFGLLARAVEVQRLTDGAFDPAMAPMVKAWGFIGGRGAPADTSELERARSLVGPGRYITLLIL